MTDAVPALRISLVSSRRLLELVLLTHGLAFLASVFSGLAAWLWAPLAAAVLASAGLQILRHRGRGNALVELRAVAPGVMEAAFRDGTRSSAEVDPDTVVWPFAVFLRLRLEDRRGPLVVTLWNDAAPAEDFRRLKVWLLALRWGAAADGSSA